MPNILQIQYENYHATAYKIIPKQHLAKLNSLHDDGTKRKCCRPSPAIVLSPFNLHFS